MRILPFKGYHCNGSLFFFAKKLKIIILVIIFVISSCSLFAKGKKEKDYQEEWCAGKTDVTISTIVGNFEVDCIQGEYAIEVDFAGKYYEAIGQALTYSAITGLKPGIALIIKNDKEMSYVDRIVYIISIQRRLEDLKVWVILDN